MDKAILIWTQKDLQDDSVALGKENTMQEASNLGKFERRKMTKKGEDKVCLLS